MYVKVIYIKAIQKIMLCLMCTICVFNPLDPSLLGITASPTEPHGAIGPIADIIIDHILTFEDSTKLS